MVELRCPGCGRFLQEVHDFGRAPCPSCGCEVTFRSREFRRKSVLTVTTTTGSQEAAKTG